MKMKLKSHLILFSLVCTCMVPLATHAQSEKIDANKAKDVLQKLLGEATEAVEKASRKSDNKNKDDEDAFWVRAKDNLTMERVQYTKKVTTVLAVMQAEIEGLADTEASVGSREYFKTRVLSLKQNHAYCVEDLVNLKAFPTEEEFRVRQRFFDKNLALLSDHLVVTMKEAGH